MLVENPMAANLPQCDTRIQACQAAGVIYMQCRASVFAPVHRKVRELIDEGRFGDVWQVFSFPTLAAQWTKDGFSLTVTNVTPGKTNFTQFSTDLAAANWTTIQTNIATVPSQTIIDSSPSDFPARFYRIIELP